MIRGARWGDQRLGPAGKFYEDMLWEALTDPFAGCSHGGDRREPGGRRTASPAKTWTPTRSSRSSAPRPRGTRAHFTEELTPVTIKSRKGETQFMADEHMRPETTPSRWRKLKPYFKEDGTVHRRQRLGDRRRRRGRGDRQRASTRERNGLKPIGRLVTWGIAGVEPKHMGIGPVPAVAPALKRRGWSWPQMDLVEVNEAFGSQYCAVEKELGLDRERTNVYGGAIAVSHPLGASGARITVHLLHELRRQGKRFGLGTACIGGGQGIAVVVEAFPAQDS